MRAGQAWGINGRASVSATVLAVILAMNYGFTTVWLLSIVIYAVGVAALLLTDDRVGPKISLAGRPPR